MKKSRYSDSQILAIIKQAESGVPIPEPFREHGISGASFYKWRAKYRDMDTSLNGQNEEIGRRKSTPKKMPAEERLKSEVIQEAMAKKWSSHLREKRWLWQP